QPCATVLTPLVATTWSDLAAAAGKLTRKAADARWHAARIRAKRARYAAEAVAPALGAPARRLALVAARLQDLLGEHQDAAVAAATWQDLAERHPGDPDLAFTAGRLVERERAAVRAARAAFPRAWSTAVTPALTRWLRE
ncbi:MAG: CHAD domain-containing protein, partial [Mycobacteriales bacterium]